jgi:hypothetical protein
VTDPLFLVLVYIFLLFPFFSNRRPDIARAIDCSGSVFFFLAMAEEVVEMNDSEYIDHLLRELQHAEARNSALELQLHLSDAVRT